MSTKGFDIAEYPIRQILAHVTNTTALVVPIDHIRVEIKKKYYDVSLVFTPDIRAAKPDPATIKLIVENDDMKTAIEIFIKNVPIVLDSIAAAADSGEFNNYCLVFDEQLLCFHLKMFNRAYMEYDQQLQYLKDIHAKQTEVNNIIGITENSTAVNDAQRAKLEQCYEIRTKLVTLMGEVYEKFNAVDTSKIMEHSKEIEEFNKAGNFLQLRIVIEESKDVLDTFKRLPDVKSTNPYSDDDEDLQKKYAESF